MFAIGVFSLCTYYFQIYLFTGGMEELTLDQIKKKSELEEDIDFENGDFYILTRIVVK